MFVSDLNMSKDSIDVSLINSHQYCLYSCSNLMAPLSHKTDRQSTVVSIM